MTNNMVQPSPDIPQRLLCTGGDLEDLESKCEKKNIDSACKNIELPSMVARIPLHTEYMMLAASKVDSFISFSM